MTTEEQNKKIVARYFDELWTRRNSDIIEELCSDDFLFKYPMHGPRRGKTAAKNAYDEFVRSFPDLSFVGYGVPLIAEGKYVVGRWYGGGTHTGAPCHDLAVGELKTANTGKKIRFSGTSIFLLEDGKIKEEIGEEGALTALQQLDLLPQPNPSKAVVYDEKLL